MLPETAGTRADTLATWSGTRSTPRTGSPLEPIFGGHIVDLVLKGHDDSYALARVNGAAQESTTEYGQLYQLIDVTPTTIRYQTPTADSPFHGLVIEKRNNKYFCTVDEDGSLI